MDAEPMIRGKYVRSHLKSIESDYGPNVATALRKRFVDRLAIRKREFVPIQLDNELFGATVDLLHAEQFAPERRSYEAGRLHFRAFSKGMLWQIVSGIFGKNLRLLLQQSPLVTAGIYRDVQFSAEPYGERSGLITITNQGYPLEHFRGFFEEYLAGSGFNGYVEVQRLDGNRIAYHISWSEPHIRIDFSDPETLHA